MPSADRTADYIARDKAHIWHPFTQQGDWVGDVPRPPVVIESGEGNYLVDTDGRRYLDGVSSLWCNVHGHRHPRLDAAVRAQLDRIAHTTQLGLANTAVIEATDALMAVVPDGLTRAFYSENGAAAVEVALKMAFRYWQLEGVTSKRTFLSLQEAYHGDTLGAVSVGGIDTFHAAFGPLLFDTFRAPTALPDADGATPDVATLLAATEAVLAEHADEIAAVIVEPLMQGAAGMIRLPDGHLRGVRDLCDRYGVLLICDEVATGFGRTGTMFACEAEGVVPDLMVLGKGITGGYLPMSATLATEAVYERFLGTTADLKHLFHGHTYSGNPLAAAACTANLEIFRDEAVIARIAPLIERLGDRADAIGNMDAVVDVRRRGLMIGIELDPDAGGLALPATEVCMRVRDAGVILRPLGPVIVWMPPLSLTLDEAEVLADATAEAIASLG